MEVFSLYAKHRAMHYLDAICRSGVHTSTVRQAGIQCSLLVAQPSTHLSPGKVTQNRRAKASATARGTARGGPGRTGFQKFMWAKALRTSSQKKHSGSSATCDNSDCRKSASPLERSSALLCCHLPHVPGLFLFYRYQKHKGPEASGHLSTNGFNNKSIKR